jgi:predicted Rossmann fold flavoprotein
MPKYEIAVIGGGASGICAAIGAARSGRTVVVCEKMPLLGKKILATGNGRCNLTNDRLDESYYNPAARETVKGVFGGVGPDQVLDFFRGLGLRLYSQQGRVFPVTNQAASVVKVLEKELLRLRVPVQLSFECTGITYVPGSIQVASRGRQTIECEKLILAGGGKTYPSFGSNGSLYEISRLLGHRLVEPVPCAVPLLTRDSLCQEMQGQRITARAWGIIEGQRGKGADGELLFTKYGLSGTCILDVSEEISIALHRDHRRDVRVGADLIPFLAEEELTRELNRRISAGMPPEEVLVGILPNKMAAALKTLFLEGDPRRAAASLKAREFAITGTRGWNEAEFTAGGIRNDEVDPRTLESRICRGVYFAGEILDVNGARGGYNLAWAWASGLLAGQIRGSIPG